MVVCMCFVVACSASESLPDNRVVSGSNTTPDELVTSTSVSSIPPATFTSEPVDCKPIHTITICVQDIVQAYTSTQVKLKIVVESNMVSGFGNSFIFPDDERGLQPVLLDEQRRQYLLKEDANNYWAEFDDTERVYFQTLYFETMPEGVKEITISLPMVAVDSPIESEPFQVNIGSNPQPGQIKDLDITSSIDGQTFHFVRAEFEGDGIQSLRVTLYTDPLDLPNEIFSVSPSFGDREKSILFGTKQGMNGLPLRIFADLIVPPAKSSGVTADSSNFDILNLVANRITYWYRGPFEITHQTQ